MSQVIDQAAVDTALQQFTEMMATDGYVLSWTPVDEEHIVVRIDATPEACADCLVPAPVMAAIMDKALEATPYSVDHVVLPAEH
jgi:hypothetical protein